jgi:hypothetical protein
MNRYAPCSPTHGALELIGVGHAIRHERGGVMLAESTPQCLCAAHPPTPIEVPAKHLPEPGLIALLVGALLVLWLAPASADTLWLGTQQVAWAAATGAVRYAVERSDGVALGLTTQTRFALSCRSWLAPYSVVVRGLDAAGNLGPPSKPSERFLCAANSPDLNGDGAVDALDLAAMRFGLEGAEVRP